MMGDVDDSYEKEKIKQNKDKKTIKKNTPKHM